VTGSGAATAVLQNNERCRILHFGPVHITLSLRCGQKNGQNLRIMKTITLQLRNSVNWLHIRLAFLLIALGCFALLPQARATCQEGCLTDENTVLGDDALLNNSGSANTAIGFEALFSNTTGSGNTAHSWSSLHSNTTGLNNTATGGSALNNNTTGFFNTANGVGALFFNTTGSFNTGNGANALLSNRTGNNNTGNGLSALNNNTTGSNNIALGALAGTNLTTGSNNIYIDSRGRSTESGTIRIGTQQGRTFVAGISGVTVAGGVGVIVDTNGQLGTVVSSARYKDAIKPMDKASEAILALKPVTFRYKHELDPKGIPQFGLVAEDVEKVNPDLVARDDQGKFYTVRYEAVNAMLLNEFLKEHLKVEKLEATVAQQHKDFEAAVAELKGQIQKVSAQLELS
jgi:hypothetical protein